jgi:N-acetylneuraminic acid mutarotase
MGTARRNLGATVVGSSLYAITGFIGFDYTDANERFDGTSWTEMAPIPVKHSQSKAEAVGNKIYVPGGFNNGQFNGPLDFMQIYDTVTDSWGQGMHLPAERSGAATAAFNGLVYVIAGYTLPFPTITNTVYIYDPVSDSYTIGAPMPAGQGNVPGVLFNGEIYVVGGGAAFGAHYAYDPSTNSWRDIASLPTVNGLCQSAKGFVFDNEVWIVGCANLPINQQVWIYNPGVNSWRAGPQYNVDHQGPGAALFNGRGFVVGGGSEVTAAVESYGPCPTGTPTPTPIATATPTSTATPTVTPTATPTVRPSPTARPRPTPAPRP